MKELLDIIISSITLIVLIAGLYLAVLRFGLRRERYTFLNIRLNAKVITRQEDLLLVSITVDLENMGNTKIMARTRKDAGSSHSPYLYSDGIDDCKHAGTLKIRGVPDTEHPELFDWYSLHRIEDICIRQNSVNSIGNLEQINYLNEYENPRTDYRDVIFWLEPHERYSLLVMIWLPCGVYAIKAFFLGSMAHYEEEEYWSSTMICSLV